MPWEDPPRVCGHADRPRPTVADRDRVWLCSWCGQRQRVVVVDFGHDVMPGEAGIEVRWERV